MNYELKKKNVTLQTIMKHRYFLLLTILLLTTVSVNAQRRTRSVVSESSQVVKDYLDSLNVMRKRLDSLQQVNNQLRQEQSDGRYFRLFAPTTFYHSGAQKTLSLQPRTDDELADAIDQAMMSLYLRRPDLVVNNESNLLAVGSIREDVNQELTPELDLIDIAAPVPDELRLCPSISLFRSPTSGNSRVTAICSFCRTMCQTTGTKVVKATIRRWLLPIWS